MHVLRQPKPGMFEEDLSAEDEGASLDRSQRQTISWQTDERATIEEVVGLWGTLYANDAHTHNASTPKILKARKNTSWENYIALYLA